MYEMILNLNGKLAELKMERDFTFYYQTDGGCEMVGILEIGRTGTEVPLYNSDADPLDEDIEDLYERDIISHIEAIRKQIFRNLKYFIANLYGIVKAFEKE